MATGAGKTIITATLSKITEPMDVVLVIVQQKFGNTNQEDYINCDPDVGVYFGDRKELGKTYNMYMAIFEYTR